MKTSLTSRKNRIVLALMLTIVLIPVVSTASAQSPQLSLEASGKIGVAAFLNKPIPIPPGIPVPLGYVAVLAADTYHFDNFVVGGVNYGSYDLLVIYILIYNPEEGIFNGIPVPMEAYTNAPTSSPAPDILPSFEKLMEGVYGIDVVVTEDLKVKVKSKRETIKSITMKIHARFLRKTKIRYKSLKKRETVNPDPMYVPIPTGGIVVIDIGEGRQADTRGHLTSYKKVSGVGLVSTFRMYTVQS